MARAVTRAELAPGLSLSSAVYDEGLFLYCIVCFHLGYIQEILLIFTIIVPP